MRECARGQTRSSVYSVLIKVCSGLNTQRSKSEGREDSGLNIAQMQSVRQMSIM